MHHFSKFGLVAILALGVSGAAIAQDTGVDLDLDTRVGVESDTGLDVGIDTMTTGSISTHGNLVSSIRTSSEFDLSAFNDQTTVNCVAVSTLQGDAQGNAQAIGNATAGNPAIVTLRSDIEANASLMSALESSCGMAAVNVQDIVYVETGADGSLTFYYDDAA